MTALRHDILDGDSDEHQESPQDVVARIQARGQGQTLPPPPTCEAIEKLVAHVAQQTPLIASEQEAWNHMWDDVFAEMRRRDDEDDATEGHRP